MKDVIYKKVCVACGNDFETPTKTKKICGPKCTIRYHREKVLGPVEGYDYIKCNICGQKFADFGNHYKKEHPGHPVQQPSKCQKLVDSVSGENNPGYQHGGRLSPWSKKSEHHTEEQIESSKKLAKENSLKNPNNAIHSTKIEYYLDQGMTEEEAKKALSERQKTFSLDICIEKYGEVEGRKRWADRQEKWINNFKKQNYSNISQELFNSIMEKYNGNVYYATYDRENMTEYVNKEYRIRLSDKLFSLDFVDIDNKKVIEFDGDYWHSESLVNPEREKERERILKEHGYSILRIREQDYKRSKSHTVSTCLKFLQS